MDKNARNKLYCLFVATITMMLLPIASSASLLDGLMAYYPFNGNANDLSGNEHHGTVSGATLTNDRFGNPDSAYHFNGIDSYINIGNGVKPSFPFTVGLWVNAEDLRYATVFGNDAVNHAANRWGLELHLNSGQILSNTYEGFSAPWNRLTYSSTVSNLYSPGEWHHFAVVFNANNNREMYWDGTLVPGVYSGTGSSMLYSNGDGWVGNDLLFQLPFLGELDNITVHSRALSSAEVQALVNFVPIPGAVWLFGSGLVGLIAAAKRKKV